MTATATGADHGPIVGGYQLTIQGKDLTGVESVVFVNGTDIVKTLTLPAPSTSDTTIQLAAPDLASLVGSIPSGSSTLSIDISVGLEDGTAPGGAVVSNSSPFDFNLPSITSVTATATGANHGSIVGGYQLTITGQDLTGMDFVGFSDSPTSQTTVSLPSPSASDTTITVTAPDLSSLTGSIPSGLKSLPIGVTVGFLQLEKGVLSGVESTSSPFGFNLPQITSVTATDTGQSQGSIVGGYELTITGQDLLNVDTVVFFDGTDRVKTIALPSPSQSDSVITLTAPDLASLAGSVPQGQGSLSTNVEVAISDGHAPTGFVESYTSPFDFTVPRLTSVTATATGSAHGAVAGGYELTIEGQNLIGVDTVAFFQGADRVKTVSLPASSLSDTSVTVTAPDLATLIGSLPDGVSTMPINVEAAIHDTTAPNNFVESYGVPFSFNLPRISSVTETATGTGSGGIAGGYAMTITGQDLSGVDNVVFFQGTSRVKTVSLPTPSTSDATVTVTAPDLSSLAAGLPSGTTTLPISVEAAVRDTNAPNGFVESYASPFAFDLPAPACGSLKQCAAATSTDAQGAATATSSDGTGSIGATGQGIGGVTVGRYTSDPVGPPTFVVAGSYFDVRTTSPDTFTSVSIVDCDLSGGTTINWWNPTASGGAGAWEAVSQQSYSAGPPACITITINGTTSPSLAQLTGTVFVAGPSSAALDSSTSPAPVGTGTPQTASPSPVGTGTLQASTSPSPVGTGNPSATTLPFTGLDLRRDLALALVLLLLGSLLIAGNPRMWFATRASRRRRSRSTHIDL